MVVNQEQGEGGGANGKVQCILISRSYEAREVNTNADTPAAKTTTTSSSSLSSSSSCPHAGKTKTKVDTGPLQELRQSPVPNGVKDSGPKNGLKDPEESGGKVHIIKNGLKDPELSPRLLPAAANKGMKHEISLLQYDKMDRKERIKTGYSLGRFQMTTRSEFIIRPVSLWQ